MTFFKIVEDGYITAIGKGSSGTEITEAEYNEILTVLRTKPERTATTDYRLTVNLEWEEYEIPPEPDPEPTDEDYIEVGKILMGVMP